MRPKYPAFANDAFVRLTHCRLSKRCFRSAFAFASDVFDRQKRFRLCERRFRTVKAFLTLRATLNRFLISEPHFYQATFSLGKCVLKFVSHVFARYKTFSPWLEKSKTRLSSQNLHRKVENAFIERKRKRENAFTELKRVLRMKTCLTSENVARKFENAFTERRRR